MSSSDNERQQRAEEAARRAYARELEEPEEKPNPVPKLYIVFAVLIVAWGISYFYMRTGTITGAGDLRTPVVAQQGGGSVDGAAIFASSCASCHQASGKGLAGVFPPLDGSGWVQAKAEVPVQILLHGISGEIKVGGTAYNSVMPPFGGSMSDAQIAAVATYIRQSWSNQAEPVTAEFVAKQRAATKDRTTPWAGGAEIRKLVGAPQ